MVLLATRANHHSERWFHKMNDDTATLVAKMKQERRHTVVAFPILIVVFAGVAAYAARFSLRHIENLGQRTIPEDTGPELMRAILLCDLYFVLGPMLLVTVCLFAIFHLIVGFVPKPEHKLLLRISGELESNKEPGNQQPPGAYSSKAADGLTGNAQE